MAKRIDRTVQMMRELEHATAEALERAALRLQAISKQAVSRRYTKSRRQEKFEDRGPHWSDSQIQAERSHSKALSRKRYLSKPPKAQ